MSGPAPAEDEYRRRLALRRDALAHTQKRVERLGNLRLVLVLLGLGLLLLPLFVRQGAPWWGLLPVALAFAFLGRALDRAQREERALAGAVRYYQDGLARLEERWRELPADGAAFGVPFRGGHHPADDLDLFGPNSLFQLLDRTVTAEGARTLARWLTEPAEVEELRARQAAAVELAQALDVSESLASAAAGDDHRAVEDQALLAWAEGGPPLPQPGLLQLLGVVLPSLFLAAFGWWAFTAQRGPMIWTGLLLIATVVATRKVIGARAQVLSGPERALSRYAKLIETVEALPLSSPRLKAVQDKLWVQGEPAAARIQRLRRLVEYLEWRLNAFFGLSLSPALLWELNLVLRTERWRQETGPALRGWFLAIGELEALASFGALLRERPDYSLPTFVEGPASFKAQGLSHPLIDRRKVVANDLRLDGPGSVLLLSGSNMSGKSTLLRSVGLAVVMARAGAPVAARQLELTPLLLMTSVRIVDSLAAGTSHFYAELLRLKAIVDRAKEGRPLLYLLDEVLHGTNSRERYLGAVAVIRWLASTGAMGIVTTHDLSLAKVKERLPPEKARNQHFSDEVQGDRIHFDYQLRDGPIQSTNALRLMRAVGIDLDYEEE